MNDAATSLYRHAVEGNINEARLDLNILSMTFSQTSFDGVTGVEGIHALSEAIIEAKQALINVMVTEDGWQLAAAKIRLAVDSLNHPEQPLWHQYYKVLTEDLNAINKARLQGAASDVQVAYQTFRSHYEVIRPAAIIQRDPSEIQMIDSWLSYMEGLCTAATLDSGSIGQAVDHGQNMLKELFHRQKDEPVFVPVVGTYEPWIWSVLIGLTIITVLIYVAYRKYQGEQEMRSVEQSKEFRKKL
nr:sporulation protein YpjB [Paenibacillus sediminis]